MPIIGAEAIQSQIFRISVLLCHDVVENIIVSPDGLYNINYIKAGKMLNATGKILNVVQNKGCPKNSYLIFDASSDNSSKRERILFYQIQTLKDVTPNDAYNIARKHGFEGTVEEWLESLRGGTGKSAYELAVMAGFEGSLEEWLESLKGEDGKQGERGADGKSAYEIARENGFRGTEQEWLESIGDTTDIRLDISNIKIALKWDENM